MERTRDDELPGARDAPRNPDQGCNANLGLAGGIPWSWLGDRDLADRGKIGRFLYGQALIFAPYAFKWRHGGL